MIHGIIQDVAQENALFALFSALPDVLPNVFALGWAAAEFASDTAVLTVNQVRMAFLIAAASDRPVGFLDQKRQIASIVAGAFGWRAMARELAGKIPFGGGLIPKAAISYAGTYVVGLSLERFYRIGYGHDGCGARRRIPGGARQRQTLRGLGPGGAAEHGAGVNPVAVVTGASRGIGRGIARELARTHQIVGTYKGRRDAAESLRAETGAEIFQCDVASAEDRQALLAFTRDRFGRLGSAGE